jgi:hypothetical protein
MPGDSSVQNVIPETVATLFRDGLSGVRAVCFWRLLIQVNLCEEFCRM